MATARATRRARRESATGPRASLRALLATARPVPLPAYHRARRSSRCSAGGPTPLGRVSPSRSSRPCLRHRPCSRRRRSDSGCALDSGERPRSRTLDAGDPLLGSRSPSPCMRNSVGPPWGVSLTPGGVGATGRGVRWPSEGVSPRHSVNDTDFAARRPENPFHRSCSRNDLVGEPPVGQLAARALSRHVSGRWAARSD